MKDFTPNQKKITMLLFTGSPQGFPLSFFAEILQISPDQAAWDLEILKKNGVPVCFLPEKRYALNHKSESFNQILFPLEMQHLFPGKNFWFFENLPSTQRVMKAYAAQGAPEGSLVLGETQSSGKGRAQRAWASPKQIGLYFSLLLKPKLSLEATQLISLLAGVGVWKAIKKELNLECELKWPNDILFQGKKFCGILSEAVIQKGKVHHIVVGIGVNVKKFREDFPRELRPRATNLEEASGCPVSRKNMFITIYREVMEQYALFSSSGISSFLKTYKRLCSTLGQHISVKIGAEKTLEGRALDITENGALLIGTEDNVHTLYSGDVSHVRPVNN